MDTNKKTKKESSPAQIEAFNKMVDARRQKIGRKKNTKRERKTT